jgi:hypothetical protein
MLYWPVKWSEVEPSDDELELERDMEYVGEPEEALGPRIGEPDTGTQLAAAIAEQAEISTWSPALAGPSSVEDGFLAISRCL